MQKRKLFLSLLALCSIVGMGITSCNNQGEQGPIGPEGPQGPEGPAGENGQDGQDGSLILTGEGKPEDSLGKDTDIYIDSKTGDLYQKENGTWTLIMNIKGEDGSDGSSGSSGQDGKTSWSNTILPSEGGYVIPSVGSATVGEKVTFTITPNEGYYLTDFSLNGSSISSDDTSLVYDSTLKEYSYTTTMVENGFVVLASFSNQAKTNYIDGVAYENSKVDSYGNVIEQGTKIEGLEFESGSGTESDPLVVANSDQFNAIANSDASYFKLDESLETLQIASLPKSKSGETHLDLSGTELEFIPNGSEKYTYGPIQVSKNETLVINNGSIVSNKMDDSVVSVVALGPTSTNSYVELDGIYITTNGCALYSEASDSHIVIKDSTINAGGYGVGTNANDGPDINVTMDIINSEINALDASGACGVLFNLNGTLNIEGSKVYGTQQGVFGRLGKITIKNSEISYTYFDNEQQNGANWSSGNLAPSAALLLGNQSSADGYQAPTVANLENVSFVKVEENSNVETLADGETVVDETSDNKYYLFAHGYSEENDVTITMDETTATNVGDEYVYENYVSVTTPSETYSSHESAFIDGQLYTSIWTKNEEVDTTKSTLVEGIKFTSGDGSVENPLVISSVEQLLLINKLSEYKFASTLNFKVDDSVTSLEVNESVLLSNDLAIEIDFNGKNVILGKEAVFDLFDNSSLRVYGNPNFSLVLEGENENTLGFYFRLGDNSMITVEDGTYNFHMTVIQLGDSSKAYVNGGTYLDPVEYNNRYYTLNLIDGCDGKFYVRGGTFESYDPSNSESENPTANFLDEGYKATSRVVEEDGTTVTYYDVVIDE